MKRKLMSWKNIMKSDFSILGNLDDENEQSMMFGTGKKSHFYALW